MAKSVRTTAAGAAAAVLLILGRVAGAQQGAGDAVELELDPAHHVVFENASLRVLEADLPAGASTLFHCHRHDNLAVVLGDATVSNELQGQPAPAPRQVRAGDVLFAKADDAPYVHRVVNTGTTVFRVIDIEFKQPAGMFPPPAALPASAQAAVALDNERVRVSTFGVPAGTATPKVRLGPGLVVALPGSEIEQVGGGGQSLGIGAEGPRWHLRPGGIYEVRNGSDHPATAIEIEIK